jgi:hypothetical protein
MHDCNIFYGLYFYRPVNNNTPLADLLVILLSLKNGTCFQKLDIGLMKTATLVMIAFAPGSFVVLYEFFSLVKTDTDVVAFVYICISYVILSILNIYLCVSMFVRGRSIENIPELRLNMIELHHTSRIQP